jgi:RNA 2',3'-cyclic 3'-phosphodiesterase
LRLFVAVVPPPAVLAELEAEVAPLRPSWPGLRWTGMPAWHLTLAFLGEVSEDTAAELGPRLGRAAHRYPVLSLSFAGGGAFPSPGRGRVLWTGVRGDRQVLETLEALARSVAAGARRAGAPPPDEGRRFRPHLTLARCREPADVSGLVGALSAFAGEPWTAQEIHLIRSYLGAAPRYESVGSWPLRSSSSSGPDAGASAS